MAGKLRAKNLILGVMPGVELGSYKKRVDHTDFEAAAVSDTVALADFPTNVFIVCAWFELEKEFVAPTGSAATMSFGDTAAATEVLNAIAVYDGDGEGIKVTQGAMALPKWEADYATAGAKLTLTLTDDNCQDLTAGRGVLHVVYMKPRAEPAQ